MHESEHVQPKLSREKMARKRELEGTNDTPPGYTTLWLVETNAINGEKEEEQVFSHREITKQAKHLHSDSHGKKKKSAAEKVDSLLRNTMPPIERCNRELRFLGRGEKRVTRIETSQRYAL